MNAYQLTGRLQTSGLDTCSDVNQRNHFNMTPAQVATQAGNVAEFQAITTSPKFDIKKMGKLQIFLQILQRDSEVRFAEFVQYFQTEFALKFHFDRDLGEWQAKS